MASVDPSACSSFEAPTHALSFESSQMASHDANRSMGELTVVNVDPQRHPKNKRKRTQAGDKAILEAAYRENPKPDKIARVDIVKRVSLNEKEVQIWFQNRRQNDRRKSRPLTPQEIAALRCGGMQIVADPSIAGSSILAETPYAPASSQGDTPNGPSPASSHVSGGSQAPEQSSNDATHGSPENGEPKKDEEGGASEPAKSPTSEPAAHSPGLSQSFPGATGYLANRWNASTFSTPSSAAFDDTLKTDSFPPSSCSSTRSDAGGASRSRVRLSFSFEGKAEIVSNETSPPRMQYEPPVSTAPTLPHMRPRGLHRSHSALPSVTLPPISTLTGGLPPPRLARGRSRDVNAWELCCDDDAPDDLTKMAENEANGSALAAISLLRSSGSVLQPSSNKRNAPLSKRNPLAKKPKLGKSHSSIARLADPGKRTDENGLHKDDDVSSKKLRVSMLVSPSGDSDKENLSPDEDGNPNLSSRRRPLPEGPSRRTDRVLQEQRFPSISNSRVSPTPFPQRGKRGESPLKVFEDGEKGEARGGEVDKFMRGEVSPGKKGDADCVAGLLALSQGNWR